MNKTPTSLFTGGEHFGAGQVQLATLSQHTVCLKYVRSLFCFIEIKVLSMDELSYETMQLYIHMARV